MKYKIRPLTTPNKFYQARFSWDWLNRLVDAIWGEKFIVYDETNFKYVTEMLNKISQGKAE